MDGRWPLKKKTTFVFLLALFLVPIPVIVLSSVPALFLVILVSIAGGCCTWWAVGRSTPFLVKVYLRTHARLTGKTGPARTVALLEDWTFSPDEGWDSFYRALQDSLFPTVIALSLIGYILRDVESVANTDVFVILNFAPVIVLFVVPLWIVQDSKLYYLDRETKEVIALGRMLNIRLKSIGGVIALALFTYTLYTVTGTMQGALHKLLLYFSHIYPTITVTSLIYHRLWHTGFARPGDTSRGGSRNNGRLSRTRRRDRPGCINAFDGRAIAAREQLA